MDLRYAKPLGGPGSFQRERSREPTIARGTDFDLSPARCSKGADRQD
jgi:hypothetical protein